MSNEIAPRNSGRFVAGHGRVGGKKRGNASRVRDLVDQLGPNSDPIRFMLLLIRDRTYQQVTIDADGKKKKSTVAAPLDLIVDCCKVTAQYLAPRLSAVSHTGEGGEGPIVSFDITPLLQDAATCKLLQDAALALAEAEALPRQLPPAPIPGLSDPDQQ